MTLTFGDKQYFKIDSVDKLVKLVEESVVPLEEPLGKIVRGMTYYKGKYFSIERNPHEDILLLISTREASKQVPQMLFSVGKSILSGDNFSHGRVRTDLKWNQFIEDWLLFYNGFAEIYDKILNFVRANHTGEKYLVTGAFSQWDDEEKNFFVIRKVKPPSNLGILDY